MGPVGDDAAPRIGVHAGHGDGPRGTGGGGAASRSACPGRDRAGASDRGPVARHTRRGPGRRIFRRRRTWFVSKMAIASSRAQARQTSTGRSPMKLGTGRYPRSHSFGERALRRRPRRAFLARPSLPLFRRCVRPTTLSGTTSIAFAALFHLSQKSAWLRLGETLRDERATVNREGIVRVRSAGAFPWQTIDVLGEARGRKVMPGLARTKLRGGVDSDCVALRAR